MSKVDYWSIIDRYIKNSWTKNIYVAHVSLVTAKALKIAKSMELSPSQLQFIEEAAMLHDIGIVEVDDAELGCEGALPYICHGTEGRNILEDEGLPRHALVCERHTGVGISRQQIESEGLPLPTRDMLAESIEEKIISWADLFYSKDPSRLLIEKSMEEAYKSIARFGEEKVAVFNQWKDMFTNIAEPRGGM